MSGPSNRDGSSTPIFSDSSVTQGFLLAAVTLLAFFLGMRMHGAEGEGLKHAIAVAFMTLALVQVVHVFSSRSESRSAFDAHLFKNGWLWGAVALCVLLQVVAVYVPLLRAILHTVPLGTNDWGVVAGCALLPLVVVELVKLGQRRFARSPGLSLSQPRRHVLMRSESR